MLADGCIGDCTDGWVGGCAGDGAWAFAADAIGNPRVNRVARNKRDDRIVASYGCARGVASPRLHSENDELWEHRSWRMVPSTSPFLMP
jgi:hypothetical protein